MSIERIKQFFIEQRGVTPVQAPGLDDPLFGGGFLDSLAMVEFVSYLEQEFGIALSDDDVVLENFESIRAVAAMVEDKQSA